MRGLGDERRPQLRAIAWRMGALLHAHARRQILGKGHLSLGSPARKAATFRAALRSAHNGVCRMFGAVPLHNRRACGSESGMGVSEWTFGPALPFALQIAVTI